MKLPKPRGELIDDIASSLFDKPIPIGMVPWRNREWLEGQDDRTLLRCYLDTSEFRLNPNHSTNFLEAGISPAERHARVAEFVLNLADGEVRRLAVEAMQRLFEADDMIAALEEGKRAQWGLSRDLAGLAQRFEERRKEEPRMRGRDGGTKSAAHWKAVEAEAVRVATELGLASGAHSAEYVAGQIRDRVRAFARQNGRDFPGDPTRKIAEYLRKAGIKRVRSATP